MRARSAAVALLAALTLTGCGVSDSTKGAGDQAPAPSGATPPSGATVPSGAPAPSGATVPSGARVPNVVGSRLSDAEHTLSAAGFRRVRPTDGTGRNRVVINPANWVVRSQNPAGGAQAATSTRIVLTVTKPSDGAGSTTVRTGVVPDVVCKDLQAAQDALRSAGFFDLGSQDGTGKARRQILDRDWVVIAQSVAAGQRPDPRTRIVLTVVKFGESTGRSGCRS